MPTKESGHPTGALPAKLPDEYPPGSPATGRGCSRRGKHFWNAQIT